MSNVCPVDGCSGTRHPGWGVCKTCAATLARHLAEIPALQTELVRQAARMGSGRQSGVSGRSGAQPLPLDLRAIDRTWLLRTTLVGWIRDLEPDMTRHPADDLAVMSRWLLARHGQLVVHPAAAEVVGEIAYAVGQAWAAVDNPPDRVFLGTCRCDAELWAPLDTARVRCRMCGTEHDPVDLRGALHDRLAGHLVTTAEFAGYAVRYLGVPAAQQDRLEARIRTWASRGRVVAVGRVSRPDGPPVPTYRFGDLTEGLERGGRTA